MPLSTSDGEDTPSIAGALLLAEVFGARVIPVHAPIGAGGPGPVGGCCSCGNPACDAIGKHPIGAGWLARASANPDDIRRAFSGLWANANVGLVTGRASGVIVIDVDGTDGEIELAKLEAEHGKLPAGPNVLTGKGRHLYFRAPLEAIRNRVRLRPGLDVRGEGGFVVAPPSTHASGTRYAWASGFGPSDLALPPLSMWFLLLIAPELAERARFEDSSATHCFASGGSAPRSAAAQGTAPSGSAPPTFANHGQYRSERWAAAALERECESVASAAPGSRNHTLNTAAFNVGTLTGIDAAEARAALLDAAKRAGLGEIEAGKTITSGLAAGRKANTRSAPSRDRPGYERTNGHARSFGGGESYEPDPGDEPQPTAAGEAARVVSNMRPRFDTAALFAPLPAQRWAVPGLQLGPGRPTLIAGYGASGKTIAIQALALALAAGRPIWDRYETSPGVVLHVDYEQGLYATAKRYQRLAAGMGLDWRALENRIQYVEMPRVYLDKRGGEDEYLRACEGVDLCIIDALRGAAPHTDENDSAFRGALDVLTYASQRTAASQMVLHHAAKPKKESSGDARTVARGSSAIYDASGCVLNFVKVSNGAACLVSQVKMPAEAEGESILPFELVIEDVAIDGNPTAGARVTWRKPVPVDENAKAERQYQHDVAMVLDAVQRARGGQANQITARCGLRKARALEVLRALVEGGQLVVTVGKNRAKFYGLPGGSPGHNGGAP